jgi:hypothetical protein
MSITFPAKLAALAQRAGTDPAGAWQELPTLQPQTAVDVLHFGAMAAQIAGTALGRFGEAATFVAALRNHPAIRDADEVRRSLWRAEGVMRRCQGEDDGPAREQGIANSSDACRYAGVLAQTLAARGRLGEALPHLREATALATELPDSDPVIAQTGVVAQNLQRIALGHAHAAHELLLAAASASEVSDGRTEQWQRRHLVLFGKVRAQLVAGRPGEALRGLHALMDLEDLNAAGPVERFHTAALACRAYHARGDLPQAARTLEACRDFARRATTQDLSPEVLALDRLISGA